MQAKNKTIRSKQGASEVIGSLLAVAITVILLSAVILWIISLPPPTQGAKADLSASLDIGGNGGVVKLTHKGGETLKEEETTIFVFVDYKSIAYKISQGIDKNELGIGDTWQILIPEITKDSQVSIAVKDTKNEEIIMDSVLRGTEIIFERPTIAYAVCVPDRIPNDGSIPFKVKAYVSSIYDIKEVVVDLTIVNGNPSEQLTDANQDNIYETNFIYIQRGFPVGNYSFVVKATNIRGNETTANARLEVYWADNTPPIVIFIKPLNNEVIDRRPIEIIAEYYDEVGGSGIDINSVKMLVDPGTVGGGDTYYASSQNGIYIVTENRTTWIPYNLEENTYTITVIVKDRAGNTGSGKVFFTVRFSVDLCITVNDIYFSNPHPNIGTTITISAKIRNIGGTNIDSAVIEFYDGILLIGRVTLTDIISGSYKYANITWLATPAGSHTITVKIIDVVPTETILTNNEASKELYVNRHPVVTFIYPAGGEVVSGTITIIWTIDDDIGDIHTATLQYGIEGTRTTWNNIVSNIPSPGNYVWNTTTLPDGTYYLLRIIVTDNYGLSGEDITNFRFAIENVPTRPEVLVIVPNGGEIWSGTQNILYRITDPDAGEPITLTVQHNSNGAGWTNIDIFDIIIDWTVGTTYDGRYAWDTTTVPDGINYLIRIIAVDRAYLSGNDISDNYFAIENVNDPPTARVISPNGGEIWSGTQNIIYTITDIDAGDVQTVTIQHNNNDPSGNTWITIGTAVFNMEILGIRTGTLSWDTTTVPDGTQYLIKVITIDSRGQRGEDVSDDYFSIENVNDPPIALVVSPNGGEVWSGIQTIMYRITDIDAGDVQTITIQHNNNRGMSSTIWTTITTLNVNMGTSGTLNLNHNWNTATVPDGTQYLIKVITIDSRGQRAEDISDDVFSIENVNIAPSVTVISPNGGEVWFGTRTIIYRITDIDAGDVQVIAIQHNSNGAGWVTITTTGINMGTFGTMTLTYSWDTTTVPDGNNYLIRVISTDARGLQGIDTSDNYFSINNVNDPPNVRVISPVQGDTWCRIQNIRWIATDNDGDILTITIEYSSDNGLTWNTIVSGIANTGSYPLDTTTLGYGTNYRIKVKAWDGYQWGQDISGRFTINNGRTYYFHQESPGGGAPISQWRRLDTRNPCQGITQVVSKSLNVPEGTDVIIDVGTRGYNRVTTTYSWIDISATGTAVTTLTSGNYDDGYTTLTLPFAFNFYDVIYPAGTLIYVGTNGIVSFSSSGMTACSNVAIPNTRAPNNMIAVVWDDLDMFTASPNSAKWYYQTFGTSPNRYFVITWYHWSWRGDSNNGDTIDFQLILYENRNIVMQYKDMYSNYGSRDYGRSATSGIENLYGDVGTQYSHNTASLTNSLAVIYTVVDPTGREEKWITPPVTQTTSLTGTWTFYIWGRVYGGNYQNIWAVPFVNVYKYNPSTGVSTFLFKALGDECVNYFTSWHEFSWTYTVSSSQCLSLASGERLYVQVGVQVNRNAGAVMVDFGYDSSAQNSRIVLPVSI